MLEKDSAICIRTVDYSETSQILTFFTREHGKISVIAKGSRRAKSSFGGPIELLSWGQLVFTLSDDIKLSTATEFDQRPAFTHLTRNYHALNCSLFAAELISSFTDEHDPHPDLYDAFLQYLQNQQSLENPADLLRFLILFQIAILGQAGLSPTLDRCVNCKSNYTQNWQQVFFSSEMNGLICRDCEHSFVDRQRLSKPVADCLANLRLIESASLDTLRRIEKLMIYHITEHLSKPPRLAKSIIQI